MKIVMAGGSGFVGRALTEKFIRDKHEVVWLTRDAKKNAPTGVKCQIWDGRSLGDWTQVLESADCLINLCGEGIADKRWTEKRKQVLRASRLEPLQVLVQALNSAKRKPHTFISASAVGYYGAVAEAELTEKSDHGKDFLSELCVEWEEAALQARDIRIINPRFGVVLGDGGILKKMKPAFNAGLGGVPGSGNQWMSWIHIHDAVDLFSFLLKNEKIGGPVNFCSPYPVRMREFCSSLGRVLGKPVWLPMPSAGLRLVLGEMADMLLTGQRVTPKRVLKNGYKFRYSFLETSLIPLLSSHQPQ